MPCIGAWCDRYASWLDDLDGSGAKFASLWGHKQWKLRGVGEQGCWHSNVSRPRWGDPRQFFANVLAGKSCERNWFEGAAQQPSFETPAPALLGYDRAIWRLCSQESGHRSPAALLNFSQRELAARCIASSNNILRILTWKWSMCKNLAWQLCAATGKLPGQSGKTMRFAIAPKNLRLSEWERPTHCLQAVSGPCKPGEYGSNEIYYAEVAIFRAICANAGELFTVGPGDPFKCDVDVDAFNAFAERLMATDHDEQPMEQPAGGTAFATALLGALRDGTAWRDRRAPRLHQVRPAAPTPR